jgi:hypothetical protein
MKQRTQTAANISEWLGTLVAPLFAIATGCFLGAAVGIAVKVSGLIVNSNILANIVSITAAIGPAGLAVIEVLDPRFGMKLRTRIGSIVAGPYGEIAEKFEGRLKRCSNDFTRFNRRDKDTAKRHHRTEALRAAPRLSDVTNSADLSRKTRNGRGI